MAAEMSAAVVPHEPLDEPPTNLNAVMQTTAIIVVMSPYSMAVAPDSFRIKRRCSPLAAEKMADADVQS